MTWSAEYGAPVIAPAIPAPLLETNQRLFETAPAGTGPAMPPAIPPPDPVCAIAPLASDNIRTSFIAPSA